jgi:hypothetical protein
LIPEYKKYDKIRINMYLKNKGKVARFDNFIVDLPSDEIVEAYEKKVKPYKLEIRTNIAGIEDEKIPVQNLIDDIFRLRGTADSVIRYSQRLGNYHVYAEDLQESYVISQAKSRMLARKVNEILDIEKERKKAEIKKHEQKKV